MSATLDAGSPFVPSYSASPAVDGKSHHATNFTTPIAEVRSEYGVSPAAMDQSSCVQTSPSVVNRQLDISWRGLGGRKPTVRSIEFDRQLDKLAVWIEQWDHVQRCDVVEKLLHFSNLKQFQFIWTVIQPAMHRDFMYTAKKEFPTQEFSPISTHSTRKLKDKLMYMHKDNYFRIGSAHIQHYNQVKDVNKINTPPEGSASVEVLPEIPQGREMTSPDLKGWKSQLKLRKSYTSLSSIKPKKEGSLTLLKAGSVADLAKITGPCSIMFDGKSMSTLDLIANAPPSIRFIEMPIRRHIQDEESPRIRENSNLSSLSLNNPSMASQLSLRERKKRINKGLKHYKSKPHPQFSPEALNLINWYIEQWDDLQRNEFLHKFLIKLDPRQHYFISTFLALKQYRDFIGLLPVKLAYKILGYLKPKDLVRASRVNNQWHKFCNDNSLWKKKCMEVELEVPVHAPPGKDPDWKKLYRDNKSLKTNWTSGKCEIIDCKGHHDRVLCVTFDETRLVTGSADKNIKVWNLKDGKCIQTLRGHVKGVWCLTFFTQNLLISAGYDCTIKVWNMREGNCTRTMLSHEGPVWCLARRGNTLVSGSQDRTAKVWDVSKCVIQHTLKAHNYAVFCVDMDEEGKLILTGSADRSVRQWDAQTGKQLKIIWVSQTTSIMSISYSQGFFACTYGDTICLYKKNGKLVRTYLEHSGRIETVELRITDPTKISGTMVSGGKDGSVKYWDLHRNRTVQSYRAHLEPVSCVHVDETRIASTGYDNKVKIYDFNVQ